MKKTLLKAAGVIALAASVILASCSTDMPSLDSRIDTVLQLEAPVVSVKAYPGMNYVSWKPVTSSNGYVVYRYADGMDAVEVAVTKDWNDCHYVDTKDLKNNVVYTYIVEACSKSDPSRAIAVKNSKSGEVSCVAIMPPVGTKALEMPAYENGFDGKTVKTVENDDYVLTASNIDVAGSTTTAYADDNYKGKFTISYPSKAYLNYSIYVNRNNEFETLQKWNAVLTSAAPESDNAVNNRIDVVNGAYTAAGTYKFYVKASPVNTNYSASDYVVSEKTVVKAAIETITPTGNPSVTRLNTNNANTEVARVTWTPAVLSDGTVAAAKDYTVYRYANGSFTKLAGDVAADVSNTNGEKVAVNKYYIDDKDFVTTVENKFYVVLSKDNMLESNAKVATLSAYDLAYTDAPTVAIAFESDKDENGATVAKKDGIANDAKITVTIKANQVLESVSYAANTNKTIASALVNTEVATELYKKGDVSKDYTTYIFYAKDIEADAYVAVRTVVSDKDSSLATSDTRKVSDDKAAKVAASYTDAPTVKIALKALDDDDGDKIIGSSKDVSNDVYITVSVNFSNEETEQRQSLNKVVYATSTKDAADALAKLDETKNTYSANDLELSNPTITNGKKFYYFTLKDVAEKTYIAVKAVASEPGKKDKASDTAAASVGSNYVGPVSSKTCSTPYVSVTAAALDTDKLTNDVILVAAPSKELVDDTSKVTTVPTDEVVTLYYATSTISDADAKARLESVDVRAVAGTAANTAVTITLKDLPQGTFVAAYAVNAAANKASKACDSVASSKIDTTTTATTSFEATNVIVSWATKDSTNKIANDAKIVITKKSTQTLKSVVYATSKTSYKDAVALLTSERVIKLDTPAKSTTDYSNDTITYWVDNCSSGTYIAVKATVEETVDVIQENKAVKVVASASAISTMNDKVGATKTVVTSTLKAKMPALTALDNDLKANDIKSDVNSPVTFTLTISENAKIKSIVYAPVSAAVKSEIDTAMADYDADPTTKEPYSKTLAGQGFTVTELTYKLTSSTTTEASPAENSSSFNKTYTITIDQKKDVVQIGQALAIQVIVTEDGCEDWIETRTNAISDYLPGRSLEPSSIYANTTTYARVNVVAQTMIFDATDTTDKFTNYEYSYQYIADRDYKKDPSVNGNWSSVTKIDFTESGDTNKTYTSKDTNYFQCDDATVYVVRWTGTNKATGKAWTSDYEVKVPQIPVESANLSIPSVDVSVNGKFVATVQDYTNNTYTNEAASMYTYTVYYKLSSEADDKYKSLGTLALPEVTTDKTGYKKYNNTVARDGLTPGTYTIKVEKTRTLNEGTFTKITVTENAIVN